MNNTKTSISIFLLLVTILLQACGPVARLPNSNTKITGVIAGTKLKPPQDKALVYVIRSSTTASLVKMQVMVDKVNIGFTQGRKFLYAYVPPGKHLIAGAAGNLDDVPIILKPGMTYYFEQKPTAGFAKAGNKIRRIDEKKGKRKLAKCKLSRSNYTLAGF